MPVTKTAQTAARRISSRPAPKQPYHCRLEAHIKRLNYSVPKKYLNFLKQRLNEAQLIPLLDLVCLATKGQPLETARILKTVVDHLKKGKTFETVREGLEATAKWSVLSEHRSVKSLHYLWKEGFDARAIDLYFRSLVEQAGDPQSVKAAFELLPHLLATGLTSFEAFHAIRGAASNSSAGLKPLGNNLRQGPEALKARALPLIAVSIYTRRV